MKHRSRGYQKNGRRNNNNNRNRDNNQQNFQPRSNNQENNNRDNRDRDRSSNRPIVQSVLPSPEIFQEYEYASEGTVARLLEMAETEQDRRNAWENEYLRFHKKSLRLGQLFGFILLFSVIWGTVYLASHGEQGVAMVLCGSSFFSVAAASLFSEIGRRLSRRPKMDRRQ